MNIKDAQVHDLISELKGHGYIVVIVPVSPYERTAKDQGISEEDLPYFMQAVENVAVERASEAVADVFFEKITEYEATRRSNENQLKLPV